MVDHTASLRENEKICAVCKIPASQTCGRCKLVYYCGREHQKFDWKSHSENCKIFDLVEDAEMGRHYVATRNIEIDEIVLRENKPLLAIPNPKNLPSCINCYAPLTFANGKCCKHCGWILCADCTEHGPECELTLKYRKSRVTVEEYLRECKDPMLLSIPVLRALDLREKNPKAYRKFIDLKDEPTRWTQRIEEMDKSTNGLLTRSRMAVSVKKLLKINDADEDEITKILTIAGIYGFDVSSTSTTGGHIAIFEKASYIAHSCLPNCRADICNDSTNEGKIIIRAVTPISKGDPITISYTSTFYGTVQRRNDLKRNKFFDCTCNRCKDPTEFGTMFNSIKCINCDCTGYMLPLTFLVSSEAKIPDFVCDTCKLTTPSTIITEMLNELYIELSKIPSDAKLYRKFINKYLKIFHGNHHLIFRAEYQLTLALEPCMRKTLNNKLMNLVMKIMPNQNEMRGILLHKQSSDT